MILPPGVGILVAFVGDLEAAESMELAVGELGTIPSVAHELLVMLHELETHRRIRDPDPELRQLDLHIIRVVERDDRFVNQMGNRVVIIALGHREGVERIDAVPEMRVVRHQRKHDLEFRNDRQEAGPGGLRLVIARLRSDVRGSGPKAGFG